MSRLMTNLTFSFMLCLVGESGIEEVKIKGKNEGWKEDLKKIMNENEGKHGGREESLKKKTSVCIIFMIRMEKKMGTREKEHSFYIGGLSSS